KALETEEAEQVDKLDAAISAAESQLKALTPYSIISEVEYRDLSLKYGHIFKAGIGSEAIRSIFEKMDMEADVKRWNEELPDASAARRKRIMRRLSLVQSLIKAGVRPEWMFVTVLPVIPPDLRPMVQLDG